MKDLPDNCSACNACSFHHLLANNIEIVEDFGITVVHFDDDVASQFLHFTTPLRLGGANA